MILVDTSVWIRFLLNKQPYADHLQSLLMRDEVVGHDLVFGELLIGDPGGRLELFRSYGTMNQAPTVPHREVVDFVLTRGLHGLGVGWVDVHLLASAVVAGVRIWTADPRFHDLAESLRIAYEPKLL